MAHEPLIAVFIDYENLALGVRDMNWRKFQIDLILRRLLEKGRVVYKRAYCDWRNYSGAVREFHAHGIEMIDIPQSKVSGKNSADIRMVVDAIDLCYAKPHIDTFALISGDSDFSPLASKLKENEKRVLGCGIRSSTSDLLVASCDEFVFYDDLVSSARKVKPKRKKRGEKARDKKQEALDMLMEIIQGLESDYDTVWGSAIKQAMKRVYPGFAEQSFGYRNFSALLNDGAAHDLIDLEYDERRGNYMVKMR